MTRRELVSTSSERTPVVAITAKPGVKFLGKLLDKGVEVKVGLGVKTVYQFEIHDTDAPIVAKGADGNYVDVNVDTYDKVAVFATKLLSRKLSNAQVGEIIEISYLGKEKGKNGQQYHNFRADVLGE